MFLNHIIYFILCLEVKLKPFHLAFVLLFFCVFNTWVIKLPWVEFVVGDDRGVNQVKRKICLVIGGQDKLLVPKLDSLWKHTS